MKKPTKLAISALLSLVALTPMSLHATSAQASTPSQISQVTGTLLDAKEVVPEIIALGLNPQVYKVSTSQLRKLEAEQDKYALQINLGKMNQDQFNKLLALYGGQSKVSFNPDKSYDLIDFLPPVIQATVNKTFQRTYYDLSQVTKITKLNLDDQEPGFEKIFENGINFSTNCWNSALEVIKFILNPQEKSYILTWPGRIETNNVVNSDYYSTKITENKTRFGDALVISTKGVGSDLMIQHIAIILGKNLVFEKTDSSENDPYRLSLKTDVIVKYKSALDKAFKITFKRFGNGEETFPPPFRENIFEFEPNLLKQIKKIVPNAPYDHLLSACETTLMGACNWGLSEYREAQIKIDPVSGRGILVTDPTTQKRLKPLE